MKVYFYSSDPADGEMAEQALTFESAVVSPTEVPSAEEGDVVVIDFALGKKTITKIIQSNPGPVYILFYNSIKSKELKEIENSEHAPHACLKRPVTEDFLMDVAQDFLDSASDSGAKGDQTRTKSGVNELTFIGIKKPDMSELKKASDDLDFDEEDVSGDEDSSAAVPMQEFKMSSDIKEILKKHSLSKDRTPDFQSEGNQEIQKKFDFIFPDESFPESTDGGVKFAPIDEDLMRGIVEDVKPIDTVSLNFDGDIEEAMPDNVMPLKKENQKKILPKEESMSDPKESKDKDDLSLTFDLGSELDGNLMGETKAPAPAAATSKKEAAKPLEDEIGMDLDFSADEIKDTKSPKETEKLPEAGGLELGDEDAGEGATTVFKGASVEMSLEGGDDLLIEGAGGAGVESTKTATSDDLDLGDEGIELESASGSGPDKKSSAKSKSESMDLDMDMDLDLDMDDKSEEATKVSTKKEMDDANQEFDYKSSIHKTEKLKAKVEEDDINLDEDIDMDAGDDIEASLAKGKSDAEDSSLDDISFDNDDAATKVFSSADNKKNSAKPKVKKVEVFDVSESDDGDGDDEDSPMIIGMDKIPTASLNENDLVRLQSTTRHLKEERELLLKEIERLKDQKREITQENLGLKTENDDLRIEISILRKRHDKDLEDVRSQVKTHEERKALYEEKLKLYQKEIEKLNHKLRVDFGKVKQREKELESQLELQSMDSENQIVSRDKKILDLKRKIDSLEFNMENVSIREQKFREDKMKLEDRMNKIMHTLRNSIQVIEDDLDLDEDMMEKLTKGQE